MAANSQGGLRAAADRARDLLGLERVGPLAGALTPAPGSKAVVYYEAALRRIEIADALRDARKAVAALRLYREGLVLLVAAIAVAHDAAAVAHDPDPTDGAAAVAALTDLARAGHIPALPAAVEQTARRLVAPGLLAFDGGSTDELLRERDTAASALRWLRRLVDPQRPRRPRRERALLWAAAAVALVAGVASSLHNGPRVRNIALDHPVVISERHPDSQAPADNSWLTNGKIESTYAVETSARDAWVIVQLTGIHEVTQIKIYNRADGWFDEGLPLSLEMSENGRSFTEVGRRTTPFTAASPWVFDAAGRRAATIRIRSPKYIALTEVEVYEKQP